MTLPPPRSTLFPYTTLFRSRSAPGQELHVVSQVSRPEVGGIDRQQPAARRDPVYERTVRDAIGAARVAFGAHIPRRPRASAFATVADQVLDQAGPVVVAQEVRDSRAGHAVRVDREGDDLHVSGPSAKYTKVRL